MKATFFALITLAFLPFSAQAESELQKTLSENFECRQQLNVASDQLFTTTLLHNTKSDSKARLAFEYLKGVNSEMINLLAIDSRTHAVVAEFNKDVERIIIDMIEEGTQDAHFRQKYLKAKMLLLVEYYSCLSEAA